MKEYKSINKQNFWENDKKKKRREKKRKEKTAIFMHQDVLMIV